jgi:hypothetical protein
VQTYTLVCLLFIFESNLQLVKSVRMVHSLSFGRVIKKKKSEQADLVLPQKLKGVISGAMFHIHPSMGCLAVLCDDDVCGAVREALSAPVGVETNNYRQLFVHNPLMIAMMEPTDDKRFGVYQQVCVHNNMLHN